MGKKSGDIIAECKKCFFKIFCISQKDKKCDLYLDSEYVANLKHENEQLKTEIKKLQLKLQLYERKNKNE